MTFNAYVEFGAASCSIFEEWKQLSISAITENYHYPEHLLFLQTTAHSVMETAALKQ